MEIAGIKISLNEQKTIDIPIANLPSNTPIDLVAHVYRAPKEGPTLLLIGGIHGDEINGIEIVKRSQQSDMFKNIIAGTIISVPLLNVYGFINYSRGFPDGKDVNRSFPGAKKGSLASRVADALVSNILPLADFVLDFHTGGASIYNYPQARAFREDKESIQLAEEFGMPLLITGGLIHKSLRKTANNLKIPMVVFEGGESLRMDEFSINEGLRGVERVLVAKGMKEGENPDIHRVLIKSSKWLRAPKSGILKCLKVSGDYVMRGEVLGTISGPYGNFEIKVKATETAMIYGHNNQPVVNQGDAIFHLGFE